MLIDNLKAIAVLDSKDKLFFDDKWSKSLKGIKSSDMKVSA